jgi:S1-C subfamily serine protease
MLEGADEVIVTFDGQAVNSASKIIGTDKRSDVAVSKIDAAGLLRRENR